MKLAISRRNFLVSAAAPVLAGSGALPAAPTGAGAARLVMHWYIFGPAWTKEEAARQLRLMSEAGAGGVLIFPTYPVAADDPGRGIRNQRYLSPEFLDVLRHAVSTARGLGMTVDLVLGTGWPYGGPSVSLDDSAHRLIRQEIPAGGAAGPAMPEGARQVRVFEGAGGEKQIFLSTPTRMEVKRASLGAEGWVVDHLRRAALDRYLHEVGDRLLDALPPGSLRSVFCDSLEVYRTNWTAEFPILFERRRGYDLLPELEALFDDAHRDRRDLRYDFWRTISESAHQEFIQPLQEWAHRRGVQTQVEAYGTPPVSLASYRHVDLPAGEHYEWKEFNTSRWASSGGRLAGKPVIVAEAWTWLGLPNRFADTLEQLKLCSDLHFLSGINALYAVTYAYSPVGLGSPGWAPYFGPVTNHTEPWWPLFSHLAAYVERACTVLQAGKPVADVALYLPAEDSMADAPVNQLLLNWAVRDRLSSTGPPPEFGLKNALLHESDVVRTIITNGYCFDGVDWSVFDHMRAEGGRLRQGDGDYGILVLPNLIGIALRSLEVIAEFARQGGLVIVTRRWPERVWGLKDRAAHRSRFERLMAELRRYAVFTPDERGSFLAALRRRGPDIAWREASPHVSFVHRRTAGRDYYFLANISEQEQALEGVFRAGARQPERIDLVSNARSVPEFRTEPDGCRLVLTLEPLESCVLEFADRNDLRPSPRKRFYNTGKSTGLPAPLELNLPWRLTLGSASVTLDGLKSWTEIPGQRFFSGRGVYEAEFDLPALELGTGILLDLGRVCETAEVAVNSRTAGVAWMRPYRIDITEAVRRGTNRLRIEVTNLLINRILGDGPIDYSAVFQKYGRRFPPGDEWTVVREPFVSGLLGPVRLVFYKES